MMMMGQAGGGVRRPYNLNVSVNFNNLFNNVNFANPIGNLTSGRFGQSTATQSGFGGFGGGGGAAAVVHRQTAVSSSRRDLVGKHCAIQYARRP
jgi:hypothetical protein